MRFDHSAQLVEIAIHPGRFWLRGLHTCWGLFHTEAIGTVAGEVEPNQGRDFESSFCTTMTAVPEAIEAIGVLATFGHKAGIDDQLNCGDLSPQVRDMTKNGHELI